MGTPSNQPWRPKRQLEAASASQLSNGPVQMRGFDGATSGAMSQQSSDDGGGKWTTVPVRGADGASASHCEFQQFLTFGPRAFLVLFVGA